MVIQYSNPLLATAVYSLGVVFGGIEAVFDSLIDNVFKAVLVTFLAAILAVILAKECAKSASVSSTAVSSCFIRLSAVDLDGRCFRLARNFLR